MPEGRKTKGEHGNGNHQPETRLRPGISNEFLARHNIRHVGKEESSELIGYPAPGIVIPYTTSEGAQLIVNTRPFHRIRLDDPTTAKYLSPKGSGAHLFIPKNQIFGPEMVVAESEFKAAALADAGIPTVGIGGICSAMTEGKLIPELKTLITKYPPQTIYFLGDADTCFISAFSIEAIKLAKILPGGIQLYLPRIPVTMPNGIDDCREKLNGEFDNFWKKIKERALLANPKLSAHSLAVQLVLQELAAIGTLPEQEIQIGRLANLASYLPGLELDRLSREFNKIFNIPRTVFCQSAKQIRSQRREQENEQARREPQNLTPQSLRDDPRPKLELPGSRERLASEFASELGPILAKSNFFTKDKIVVLPDLEKAALQIMLPAAFRTEVEKYIIPFKVVKNPAGFPFASNHSLSKDDADTVLQSSQLISKLPRIRAVNNVRLPVRRKSGQIELLPEGYDSESMIYTKPGGPQIMEMDVETARESLSDLYKEFCFIPGDEARATSVGISEMLTLVGYNILPEGTLRPAFIHNANAEGSGKTLLAKIPIITRLGYASPCPWPSTDEEVNKQIFASAIAGMNVSLFDNAKHAIGGTAIETACTATTISGRVLGFSKEMELENLMTFFITANGAEISSDMRRRSLQIDLLLKEARAEDRVIEHPLDDATLIKMRPLLLGILWALIKYWDKCGQPKSQKTLSSYEPWSETIGGILECNGFRSPCEPNPAKDSGDVATGHMIRLVTEMELKKNYEFQELVDLAREHQLFDKLVGEVSGVELEPGDKASFALILKRFNNRKFPDGRWFIKWSKSKRSIFYLTSLNPA